ncbi:unnamed protein product [Allacma fusca]|uniref:CRAL-TRIO domain-containing protein n=1 Tax=Allacma fusca TaxID=39272 RepID=A0A8J2P1S4_9HEXA|nr:unnamed protein product [Allacma fusca]
MRAVFIFALFLAIVLHIKGKPVETTEAELENWEAPDEIQTQLPYYLSGYDEHGRPIWIFEAGKYPLQSLLDKGPETEAVMEKYIMQAGLRMTKSANDKNPDNDLQDVIFDFEGFEIRQFANPRTIAFIIEMVQKLNLHEGDSGDNIVFINVSPAMKSILTVAKQGFGQLFDKLVILGTDKSEWEEKFLKMFPADQLPECWLPHKHIQFMIHPRNQCLEHSSLYDTNFSDMGNNWGQQIGNNNVIGGNNVQITHHGSAQRPTNSYSRTDHSNNYTSPVDSPRGSAPYPSGFSEQNISSTTPVETADVFKPTTSHGKDLANQLKGVVKFIDRKNNYRGIPLQEAFTGHLSDLCENTILTDNLITLLQDMSIVDDATARRIRTKATEHADCFRQLYESLFKNGNVDYLVYMWEKTTNNGLIRSSQIWVGQSYPIQ